MGDASASQQTNRQDVKAEAAGTNLTRDIRIENFDVSFGAQWVWLTVGSEFCWQLLVGIYVIYCIGIRVDQICLEKWYVWHAIHGETLPCLQSFP